MARPTTAESSRLMLRMNSAGTVKRLDVLLMALTEAYETGRRDVLRELEADSALEG